MAHTVKNPLKLTWNGSEYKVNKPQEGTQELVSLEVAKDLKDALATLINNGSTPATPEQRLEAIKAYNKSLD